MRATRSVPGRGSVTSMAQSPVVLPAARASRPRRSCEGAPQRVLYPPRRGWWRAWGWRRARGGGGRRRDDEGRDDGRGGGDVARRRNHDARHDDVGWLLGDVSLDERNASSFVVACADAEDARELREGSHFSFKAGASSWLIPRPGPARMLAARSWFNTATTFGPLHRTTTQVELHKNGCEEDEESGEQGAQRDSSRSSAYADAA